MNSLDGNHTDEANAQKKAIISSGNDELDSKIGGGIPVGSLMLIEGSSAAGKSVLAQQMIWGSLQDAFRVVLYTSEDTVRSLVRQMESLSLEILDFLLMGKLRVYPMELSHLGQRAPHILMDSLWQQQDRDVIVIDSLTVAIAYSSTEEVLSFFEQCKRLCADGPTIMVVLHSHALDGELLVRVRSLCDAHLRLSTIEDGKRLLNILEVAKVRGANRSTGNIVSFQVEPGWGMRVIPVTKVKA